MSICRRLRLDDYIVFRICGSVAIISPLDCYIVRYLVYNLTNIHKLFGEQHCYFNKLCDKTYLARSAMADLVYGLVM